MTMVFYCEGCHIGTISLGTLLAKLMMLLTKLMILVVCSCSTTDCGCSRCH